MEHVVHASPDRPVRERLRDRQGEPRGAQLCGDGLPGPRANITPKVEMDRVEVVVGEGQGFGIADSKVDVGAQRLGGLDYLSAEVGRRLRWAPRAAMRRAAPACACCYVENVLARLRIERIDCVLDRVCDSPTDLVVLLASSAPRCVQPGCLLGRDVGVGRSCLLLGGPWRSSFGGESPVGGHLHPRWPPFIQRQSEGL